MAHVSHKLKNSLEGALAGGGDPATSPLYVFGPFLKLIVVAGVANVTFGTSVWLVVFTIGVVSAMYRLVMRWVTDGSGGSGLSEEEFGSWAVKVNAAITFIEYTLTFLVSMAAMVTFIADRFPALNEELFGIQLRTFVAILLSVLTGWLVNRGPKVAARAFGPATAGVLLLLWTMVAATIIKRGLVLPSIDLQAFSPEYLHYTLGGYVRILAVMTGIEVFANLVAAYDGEPEKKSNMAFKSLLIIMGTTGVTMLVVGPAIFAVADPSNAAQSVFTQTMDYLLPDPLPWIGTLIGVAVLMSASAASAQGLQNLALGLNQRRYIPPQLGHRNRFDVADKPVWIEVAIVSLAFLLFGTHEETYLAIYAAGVFILLSMTGWAVTQRLLRELGEDFNLKGFGLVAGTIVASLLTTISTVIIFEERFFEGAWTYLVFIPLLYYGFTYFRSRLGAPSPELEYLGRFNAYQLAGFGFGQANPVEAMVEGNAGPGSFAWQPDPIEMSNWREEKVEIKKIAVLLDGSNYAAQALPTAEAVCRAMGAQMVLLSAVKNHNSEYKKKFAETVVEREVYLDRVEAELQKKGLQVKHAVKPGFIADATKELVEEAGIDLVVTSTRGKSGSPNWESGGVSNKLVKKITRPVLLVQTTEGAAGNGTMPDIDRIMVTLDGSIISEEALPYARLLAKAFDSELLLLSVPAVPEAENYRAPAAVLRSIRRMAENNMQNFLDAVARSLREDGVRVRTMVKGNLPARTIVSISQREGTDMIVMTSHGRGGLDLLFTGSVAERVVLGSESAVFLIPIHEDPNGGIVRTVDS